MKLTSTMLRKIIAEETFKSQRKNLSEAITRITEDEMAAWKSGDWGYVAGDGASDDSEKFLHGYESGHPMDDEGNMIKGRMAGLKRMASEICELTADGDQFPAWVQDLVAQAHETLSHVHDYLTNDEEMRNYSKGVEPAHDGTPVKMEAKQRRLKMLAEGMARITEEELNAWRNGDWGFVSDAGLRTEVSEAKKKGPSKKTAQKIIRGTKTFKDKVKKVEKWADEPEAAAAWMMHKATGKWPSEK
jgi:hypothetical protein